MGAKMSAADAKTWVDELYRKVARRWEERVTRSQFMQELTTGRLSKKAFRIFFKNLAVYTIARVLRVDFDGSPRGDFAGFVARGRTLMKSHMPTARPRVSLRADAIRLCYAAQGSTVDAPRPTHRPFEKPPGRRLQWLRSTDSLDVLKKVRLRSWVFGHLASESFLSVLEKTLEESMLKYMRSSISKLFVSSLVLTVFMMPPGVRAQESIVVGYDGHAGFQGPVWGAKDLGLFDKHGLSAELVLIPGSARGMAALLSGSTAFAQGSATAPLSVYMRGADVVVVAGALNKFPFSVVAKKEIRKPSDLVGKKIGVVNFGGSNDLAVGLALKEWNIPRNTVTVLASGGAPERLAALMSGNLDATVLSPPETVAAARAGLTILANLGDLSASFPQTLIMVRRSFLASKRDTVKRFLRAYSESIHEFKTNKERGMKVYANRLKQKDQTILEDTLAFYGPKFSFPPRVDRGGIQNAVELVRQSAEVKGEINLGQFVDESVIDELESEGFFKKLSEARTKK